MLQSKVSVLHTVPFKWSLLRSGYCTHAKCTTTCVLKYELWHLEFFELLQDHVVGHVVKEAVARCQDDVAELHVEGGAVSRFGAEVCRAGGHTNTHIRTQTDRSVTRATGAGCV